MGPDRSTQTHDRGLIVKAITVGDGGTSSEVASMYLMQCDDWVQPQKSSATAVTDLALVASVCPPPNNEGVTTRAEGAPALNPTRVTNASQSTSFTDDSTLGQLAAPAARAGVETAKLTKEDAASWLSQVFKSDVDTTEAHDLRGKLKLLDIFKAADHTDGPKLAETALDMQTGEFWRLTGAKKITIKTIWDNRMDVDTAISFALGTATSTALTFAHCNFSNRSPGVFDSHPANLDYDNTSGRHADGRPETTVVDLNLLDSRIKYFVLSIACFSGQPLTEIENLVVNVVPDDEAQPLLRFTSKDIKKSVGYHTALVLGTFYKAASGWTFRRDGGAASAGIGREVQNYESTVRLHCNQFGAQTSHSDDADPDAMQNSYVPVLGADAIAGATALPVGSTAESAERAKPLSWRERLMRALKEAGLDTRLDEDVGGHLSTKEILGGMDKDGDGRITLPEFLDAVGLGDEHITPDRLFVHLRDGSLLCRLAAKINAGEDKLRSQQVGTTRACSARPAAPLACRSCNTSCGNCAAHTSVISDSGLCCHCCGLGGCVALGWIGCSRTGNPCDAARQLGRCARMTHISPKSPNRKKGRCFGGPTSRRSLDGVAPKGSTASFCRNSLECSQTKPRFSICSSTSHVSPLKSHYHRLSRMSAKRPSCSRSRPATFIPGSARRIGAAHLQSKHKAC